KWISESSSASSSASVSSPGTPKAQSTPSFSRQRTSSSAVVIHLRLWHSRRAYAIAAGRGGDLGLRVRRAELGRGRSDDNALAALTLLFATAGVVHADGNLGNVNHVIIVMMENHSFDNYFGVLPYATGSPYHGGPCAPSDHSCVDGLTCTRDMSGNYSCSNSNLDDDASLAYAFHDARYCTGPDLQHNWQGSHQEANYSGPAGALLFSPNDGFVMVNDAQEQIDSGE